MDNTHYVILTQENIEEIKTVFQNLLKAICIIQTSQARPNIVYLLYLFCSFGSIAIISDSQSSTYFIIKYAVHFIKTNP
jgi:hypothetical protein